MEEIRKFIINKLHEEQMSRIREYIHTDDNWRYITLTSADIGGDIIKEEYIYHNVNLQISDSTDSRYDFDERVILREETEVTKSVRGLFHLLGELATTSIKDLIIETEIKKGNIPFWGKK